MAVSYKRKKIGSGIALTEIYDKKFKTNVVRISFVTPLDEKTVCPNAMLQTMLVTSNSFLRTRTEMAKYITALYGSLLGSNSGSAGDYQYCGLYASYIGDRYTLDGDVISTKVVQALLDCVFSPDIENGKFNEEYFLLRKQELIDTIAASVNDKRGYSLLQSQKLAFENEPAAVSVVGSMENAQKISQEDLVRQYDYLLKNAGIEIVICGGEKNENVTKMLTDAFLKIERNDVSEIKYKKYSPIKPQVKNGESLIDVKQSKLVMTYKYTCHDIYVVKILIAILAWSQTSKLFENVREKLSLCYYCAADHQELKGAVVIDSGVEQENIDAAKKAINEQVQAMKDGDFTEDELRNAKIFMRTQFMSNYDSVGGIGGWYEVQNTRGTAYSPEEIVEKFMKITKEDVTNCAKGFKLDTVYVTKASAEVKTDE